MRTKEDFDNKMKELKDKFDKQVNILKHLGFKGEVLLTGEVLMIVSHNKNSSSLIRKAFKLAKKAGDGMLNEFRFKEKSVFCHITSGVIIKKSVLRKQAEKMVA